MAPNSYRSGVCRVRRTVIAAESAIFRGKLDVCSDGLLVRASWKQTRRSRRRGRPSPPRTPGAPQGLANPLVAAGHRSGYRCSPEPWAGAEVAYKRKINVNRPLTVFLLAAVISYSSGVQQPGHATAVLSRHPHTRWPAPFIHEQDRASSYGSEGTSMPAACPIRGTIIQLWCKDVDVPSSWWTRVDSGILLKSNGRRLLAARPSVLPVWPGWHGRTRYAYRDDAPSRIRINWTVTCRP